MNQTAVVVDGTHRGDDSSGAAEAALFELVDFAEGHVTLFHFHAQIFLGNMDDGTTGNGGQDGFGLGGHQGVALDEDDVGAAGLLDVGAGGGIQVDVLVIALLVGIHDGIQAHGIVQTCLDMAGALGGGTVEVGDADGQRLHAALEVGTHGGDEDTELILSSGLDADDGVIAEHIGTDVQGSAGTEGGHPGGIGLDHFTDGIQEPVHGERRHLQTLGRLHHAHCIEVGTEADDAAVLGGVGLHTLEAGLGVLQDAGALVHGDVGIGGQRAFIPLAVFIVGDIAVIGLDIAEADIAPVKVLLFHNQTPLVGLFLDYPILALPGAQVNRFGRKMFL